MTAKPTQARKSVTLADEELNMIQMLKGGDSNAVAAFTQLTGIQVGSRTSEAEMLRALLILGCALVREKRETVSYERAVEADAADPERQLWRNGMRRRRTRHEEAEHA